MKIKLTVVYGEEIVEALKESFSCNTDEEVLGAFKAVMARAVAAEPIDSDDLSFTCELID